MFQRTLTVLRVSPFTLFLKDLGKKNQLAGMHSKDGTKVASRMYRSLTPVQKKKLKARAEKLRYPALDAFNRFQREHAFRFTHLSNLQRQRVIAKMWRDLKTKKQGKLVKGKGRKTGKPKTLKKKKTTKKTTTKAPTKTGKKTAVKAKPKKKKTTRAKVKVASLKFRVTTPKFKSAPKLKRSRRSKRKASA